MARRGRVRSKKWRFSDSGSRFDRRKRYLRTVDSSPISIGFKWNVVHCKRCGSRVVSNVSHCPYCGKNLLPPYRRLMFWLIVVALIGASVAFLLFFTPESKKPEDQPKALTPVVINAPEGTSFKALQVGKTIEYNKLQVTVIDNYQEAVSSNGIPIIAVEVRFHNSGPAPISLYSTQWQLESADGTRVDIFIGKTAEGESIRSEMETQALGPGATYTTTLYFAAANPSLAVFAPNALSYNEAELVTWRLKEEG